MFPIEPGMRWKQEGESCGFSRLDACGHCEKGLECDTSVKDACGVCQPKHTYPKPGELYKINTDSTS